MKKILEKVIEYSLYFWVLIFSFQSKLILVSAENNYNEIALYSNYAFLLFVSALYLIYFLKYKLPKKNEEFKLGQALIALAGLEFFLFLSIFVSSFRELSIFKYILFLLSIILFFVLINSKINFKKLIYFFLSTSVLQAFIGIYQFFSQKVFSCKYLGIAPHDAYVLGSSVLENEQGRLIRAYGGLDHPNIFGALMFFAIIFSIFLFLKYNFKARHIILLFSALLIFSLGLLVSFSRSAFLALFISLLFLLFFFLFKKKGIMRKKYFAILIILFIFFSTFSVIFRPLIIDRFNINSRLEKISLSEREGQFETASKIILEKPWLGLGLGTYSKNLITLNPDQPFYTAQPVHNVLVLIWAESGLFALIFFLLFLFFFYFQFRSSIYIYPVFIGLFVFMMLDHWLFSLPFGLLFFSLILSLTFYFSNDKVAH